MQKLKACDLIAYNDEKNGFIYNVRKGTLKITSAKDTKIFNDYFSEYLNDNMCNNDKKDFENYVKFLFRNHKDKQDVCDNIGLDKTNKLKRLEIMIATDCNLNCKYCYAHGGNYGNSSLVMQPESAISYLHNIIDENFNSVETVMFFGGEPTIQPFTIKAVCDFFKGKVLNKELDSMPVFTMVSNGTLINEFLAKIINEYSIRVTISIDGPQDINDKLRVDKKGNGSFSKIMNGVDALKKEGVYPFMIEATYTTLHHEMGYSKRSLEEYFDSLFKDVKLLIANCSKNGIYDNLAIPYNRNDEFCYYDTLFYGKHFIEKLSSNINKDYSCSAGIGSIALTPDGKIFPCHHFISNQKYCMGKCNESSLYSKYKESKKYILNTRKNIFPKCKDCWARILCDECPANLLIFENNDPSTCELKREFILKTLLELSTGELKKKIFDNEIFENCYLKCK